MKRRKLFVLVAIMLAVSAFTGCGSNTSINDEVSGQNEEDIIVKTDTDKVAVEEETNSQADNEVVVEAGSISDEQALDAIKKYCYIANPDLESIVEEGQYAVYWDFSSSDDNEIVILYRSYTGAQEHFYIDRNTGDTYVTESMPGISDEESRMEETFNVRDYIE